MTTYTKFKEYIWLVNTIYHAKAITFADINRKWLPRGEWIEVLEPQSLAEEIVEWHEKAIARYKK